MKIPSRRLGRTELQVSRLGFGGLAVTEKYMRPWHASGSEYAISLIKVARQHGFSVFDTGRSYPDGEDRMGQALEGNRERCCLVSKTLARDADAAYRDVRESLRLLRTDHVECYLVHHVQWNEELDAVLGHGGALEGLRRARDEGRIGFLGISGHRPELLSAALVTGRFDVVEVPCNMMDPWIFRDVVETARDHDVGVIAMKALAGGPLGPHANAAIRFALEQGPDCLLVGMCTQTHITCAVEALSEGGDEAERIAAQTREGVIAAARSICPLTCSQICENACPAGVPIAEILRLHRHGFLYKAGHWAKVEYTRRGLQRAVCSGCSHECRQPCPRQVDVRDMLQEAHARLREPITDYEIEQHGGNGGGVAGSAPDNVRSYQDRVHSHLDNDLAAPTDGAGGCTVEEFW
jgi:predicted aldo/keto reductase-like oxidoreductase